MTTLSHRPRLAAFALLLILVAGFSWTASADEGVEVWGKVKRIEGPPEAPQDKPKAKAEPPAARPAPAPQTQPVMPSSLQGPEKLPELRVTGVEASAQENAVTVKVSLDKLPGRVLYFSLANPSRLVVDIHPEDDEEVKIKGQLPKSISGLSEFAPAVRVNAFESSVRLVFDLKCKAVAKNAKPVITKDGKNVTIRVEPTVCAN